MFPGLAKNADLIPVWVCAGDFCALGLLPPGAQCDETIHVLLPLQYSLILQLWHMGRGRARSGEPLVAFDGRLILAAEGGVPKRTLLAKVGLMLAAGQHFRAPLAFGLLSGGFKAYSDYHESPLTLNTAMNNVLLHNRDQLSLKVHSTRASRVIDNAPLVKVRTGATLSNTSISGDNIVKGVVATFTIGASVAGFFGITPLLVFTAASVSLMNAYLELFYNEAELCTTQYLAGIVEEK